MTPRGIQYVVPGQGIKIGGAQVRRSEAPGRFGHTGVKEPNDNENPTESWTRVQQALFKAWAWDPLRREWSARDLAELLQPQGIIKGIAEITGYTERGISRWINHPERYPKLGMKVEGVMAEFLLMHEGTIPVMAVPAKEVDGDLEEFLDCLEPTSPITRQELEEQERDLQRLEEQSRTEA